MNASIPRTPKGITTFSPRLVGFLCANGAHIFSDVSNPVRRKLPTGFIGLPVADISQVQTREVLKAFLSGAEGVLIAGCELCRDQQDRYAIESQLSDIWQTLSNSGIDRNRLRMEWISAADEEKFLQTVNGMMESLRQLPALRWSTKLTKTISYCG